MVPTPVRLSWVERVGEGVTFPPTSGEGAESTSPPPQRLRNLSAKSSRRKANRSNSDPDYQIVQSQSQPIPDPPATEHSGRSPSMG